jgi:hypothetical protein
LISGQNVDVNVSVNASIPESETGLKKSRPIFLLKRRIQDVVAGFVGGEHVVD